MQALGADSWGLKEGQQMDGDEKRHSIITEVDPGEYGSGSDTVAIQKCL